MKLSLDEANLTGLWTRNCATIQQVLILKFAFGPEKFPGLSKRKHEPFFTHFKVSSLAAWYGKNWFLALKSLNGASPPYTEELLIRYSRTRTLRSANKGLLVQPKCNLKTYDYRAFLHAAPKIWNSMPASLRTCCELNASDPKNQTFFKAWFLVVIHVFF